MHITLRARLSALRSQHVFPTVRLALRRAAQRDPGRFRVLHFSVQCNHIHLIVEARDKGALSGGVRSVAIRIARYVNELLSRSGALWAERWHGRALKTPREVRHAIAYVLANFRKHASRERAAGIDPFSSGQWFDGWREWKPTSHAEPPFTRRLPWCREDESEETRARVVARPQTWLARVGWRRWGLIGLAEAPR